MSGDNVVKVTPADRGWVNTALAAITEGKTLVVEMAGRDAKIIMASMVEVSTRLPVAQMFGALQKLLPVSGPIPLDMSMVPIMLAGIGAAGGVLGTFAFVAMVAVTRGGCMAKFTFDAGAIFDPTDDKLVATFTPPAK